MFEIKSADELAKMTDEDKAQYLVEKNSHDLKESNDKLTGLIEAKASTKDLAGLKDEIVALKDARTDALEVALKAQGKEMSKLVDQVNSSTKGQNKGFKAQVIEALNAKKDDISIMMKDQKGGFKIDIEMKALQGAGDIDSGTDFADMEEGVGKIATRQPFIRELFRNRTTNKEYVKYNDQETIVRDAKNVASCAAETHLSKVTWKVRIMHIENVKDSVDVCVDMMDDYDYVEGEVRDLVDTDVKLRVDSQLLLGDNVTPNLNSVSAVSSTFAPGAYANKTATPVLADLIKVVGCQISDNGQNNKFNANYALINPVDACQMQLEKDANGNYLLPSWVTDDGVNIGSIKAIANQLIPANEMYVGDFDKGTVYSRKGLTIQFSFENNDNFDKDIVTVKAKERLNLRVRNVDANAFIHVADIATALGTTVAGIGKV